MVEHDSAVMGHPGDRQRDPKSRRAPEHHEMPSSVTRKVGVFDRFAGAASRFASRPWFFAGCVLLVVLWAPSFFLLKSVDTWQLIINTATTIVTFLMVALLQNAQTRADEATQHKLNALAEGLSSLMRQELYRDETNDELCRDIEELREAVGLEERESA